MLWHRSEDIQYPEVWSRFQGKISENGRINKYRIQDVTEDLEDNVIKHMVQYFLIREPTTSSTGVIEDETSKNEFIQLWRDCLKQKMALVCLVEEEFGDCKVAGVNMTFVVSKDDPKPKAEGKPLQMIMDVMVDLAARADVFDRHNVTEYLTAYGLSACPMYSGDNIGYELLMARDDLCRKTNLKITGTVFIGAGHHVALKAGFNVITETDLNVYTVNGKVAFPRCNPKRIVFAEKVIR